MSLTRFFIARPIRETIRPAFCLRFLLFLFLVMMMLCGPGAGSLLAMNGMGARRSATAHSATEWAERAAAERALMKGWVGEAVARSQRIVMANPNDGQTYLLLCRSFYAEEHTEEAIDACVKAVQTLPRSSAAEDWLGRAYGMKAEHAGPIAGLALALKVKAAFEAAVALDSSNGAAANDLSEFYIDAPAIIGGGLERAAALADHVEGPLPQQAHRMRALAAEKRRDYGTAEREFRAAVEVAKRPDAWADLGGFYQRRGQYDKAMEALTQCLAVDRVKDASVVDAASLMDRMNRERGVAEDALREYMESDATSDAAPVFKVRVMLGKLLAGAGDKAGAKIEFDKALEMAPGYAPAKQALQEL